MIKATKDHPAFQRMSIFVDQQVERCRPSAIKMAMAIELPLLLGKDEAALMRRVADRVDQMERRMRKRLMRYYGCSAKYVAH